MTIPVTGLETTTPDQNSKATTTIRPSNTWLQLSCSLHSLAKWDNGCSTWPIGTHDCATTSTQPVKNGKYQSNSKSSIAISCSNCCGASGLAIQDLTDSWSWVFLIHLYWLPRPLDLWTSEMTKNSPSFSFEWSREPLLQQGSWGKLSCQSLP